MRGGVAQIARSPQRLLPVDTRSMLHVRFRAPRPITVLQQSAKGLSHGLGGVIAGVQGLERVVDIGHHRPAIGCEACGVLSVTQPLT